MRNPIKISHQTRSDWLIVTNGEKDESNFFYKSLVDASKAFQIPVNPPKYEKYYLNGNRDKYFITDFIKKIPNVEKYELVIVILCNRTHDQYKYIKEIINSKIGIPSQVVRSDRFSKGMSYFSKVILQINVKLGGENYNIHLNIVYVILY